MPPFAIPSLEEATLEYEQFQGVLTHESNFGNDMLYGRPDLIQTRQALYSSQNPSYETIFNNIVSSDGQLFINAIYNFHCITTRLQQLNF